MTTDRHRALAREQAAIIYQNHVGNGRAGCDANHIATNISYEETLRRGLLAEYEFAEMFGLNVNDQVLDYGDGGVDFALRLDTRLGIKSYSVNVKAKSVQVSWNGLRKSGTHLRVPVREARPDTIYVFGIYLEPTDSAEVLRWDWGQSLIQRDERARYENGNGSECFIKPFDELRELHELRERLVAPGLLHICVVCGELAQVEKQFASCPVWFCFKHRDHWEII